jgi:hypothetical protein
MKTTHKIFILTILLVAVYGCREITVTTAVHKDGSFTRTITITGDSADVFKPDLPYPVDDSWTKAIRKDTTDVDDYTLTYTKTFPNDEQLGREISRDTGWRKQLDRKIEVRKRFGLFYSYLSYKEAIPAANPFTELDYRDYLSEEDMLWISCSKDPVTPDDSIYLVSLEERAFNFVVESALTELYRTVIEGAEKLGHPGLTVDKIEVYRDSILDIDKLESELDYGDHFDAFYDNFARWSKDTSIYLLKGLEPPLLSDMNAKHQAFDHVFDMERYFVQVEMPGLITETNSIELQGNRVKWEVDSWSVMFADREMFVESRMVNVWGYILAGAVLIALLIVLVYKTRAPAHK